MKLIDLCSGAGGLSLGMMMAGHEVVAAYDNDASAIDTYRMNLGDHAHVADLRTLTGDDLPDCDGIIGGPPCQPFSNGNQYTGKNKIGKGENDARNMIPDFIRLVAQKQPTFFMIENVPGLLDVPGYIGRELDALDSLGYWSVIDILNTAHYGVPQLRRRVIIIGRKHGLPSWPEPTHSRRLMITIRQAIGHLLTSDRSKLLPPFLKHFSGMNVQINTRNRSVAVNGKRYYHVRSVDTPAYTVVAGYRTGGMRVVLGGEVAWGLGIAHNSILQTFPDWWQWADKATAQRQIGNAVPPLLAYAIGRALTK